MDQDPIFGLNPHVTGEVPFLKRDSSGRLTADSAAAAAVQALVNCPVASRVETLEGLYRNWRYPGNVESRWARFIWRIARVPLEIFRSQVAELAREVQRISTEQNAAKLQDGVGAEYLRLCEDQRNFRKFMLDHFEADVRLGESLNLPIYDTARRIMLREGR